MAVARNLWEGSTLVSSRSGDLTKGQVATATSTRVAAAVTSDSPLVATTVSTQGGRIGECMNGHCDDLIDGGVTASVSGQAFTVQSTRAQHGPNGICNLGRRQVDNEAECGG